MPCSKEEIRKNILFLRSRIGEEEARSKSAAIHERIYVLEQFKNAHIVLAYMDFRNEVMTGEFIATCMKEGKKVALPKVENAGGGRNLSVYIINDAIKDTVRGFMGIPEPDSRALERLDPAEIDIAIIPGVAFDRNKNRIGYGGGYYDKFLSKLRKDCLKVGVAFDLQLVEEIQPGIQDIPVDMVATESMLII